MDWKKYLCSVLFGSNDKYSGAQKALLSGRKEGINTVKGYPFASFLSERLRLISNFGEIIKLVGNKFTWKIRTDMINWNRLGFAFVDTAGVLFCWSCVPKNEPHVTAVTNCRMTWNSLRRRKTLEKAGHLSPGVWEMAGHNREGGDGKFSLLLLTRQPLPLCYVLSSPGFWKTRDRRFPGSPSLSRARSRGREEEDPGNEVVWLAERSVTLFTRIYLLGWDNYERGWFDYA